MKNKLLQPLLKAGLLDIGDSDERLKNIEEAIDDLSGLLTGDKKKIPGYTLVALDPNIPKNEPVIEAVEEVIANRWRALRAKFTEPPVAIIRAVILNALYNIGFENVAVARIIYLAASSFYPYSQLGREKEIISQMISEFGDAAEKDALADWALSEVESQIKLGTLKIGGLTVKNETIKTDALHSAFVTGASRTPEGYNP